MIDLEPEEMLAAVGVSEQTKKQVYELCNKLLYGDWDQVRKIIFDQKSNKFLLDEDPETIRRMVNGRMHREVLKQSDPNSDKFARALLVLTCFSDTFFYTGKPGLTRACADVFV